MLLRTFFVLAFIAVLAQTIVAGAAALARADVHHRAVAAAQSEIAAGVQDAQIALATQLAQATSAPAAFVPPSPAPACIVTTADACAMRASVSITFASPAPGASRGCPQTACTVFLQGNDRVAERRAYATIATTVADAAGATIAARTTYAVFRIFDSPPYAALSGSLDDSLTGVTAPGDDGGSTATLLHVQYRNAATGAVTSGDVWGSQNENATQPAAAWDR